MTTNAHELGATVGAWNAVVRRARIGRERKAAALVVSSYAHANGTGIHCGVARLAVDLEVSYSTAKRNLAWLRKVGLIELVRAGNRRRNLSDEYRLILGPDVMEHLEVLDPTVHRKLIDDFREANRGSSKVTRNEPVDNSDCGSLKVTPDSAESAEDCGSPKVTPKTGTAGQTDVFCGSPMGEPPPRLCTSLKDLPPRTTTDDEDLGGRVTVGADENSKSAGARVVEIFPGAAQEARYRPPPRWSTRAQDAIAEAQARVAARKAANATAQQSETEVS